MRCFYHLCRSVEAARRWYTCSPCGQALVRPLWLAVTFAVWMWISGFVPFSAFLFCCFHKFFFSLMSCCWAKRRLDKCCLACYRRITAPSRACALRCCGALQYMESACTLSGVAVITSL